MQIAILENLHGMGTVEITKVSFKSKGQERTVRWDVKWNIVEKVHYFI